MRSLGRITELRSLDLPTRSHRDLYETAISQTQRNTDRALLTNMTDRIVQAGVDYSNALGGLGAYTVNQLNMSDSESKLVRKLYDSRLVSKTGICRSVYTDIKKTSAFCPYCEYGEVYEVDHYLPKDDFPELNILPINLVPICHACNHIKLTERPLNACDALLHPYYDRLPQQMRWLFAKLAMSANGPVLSYRVDLDPGHGDVSGRLIYHFQALELGRRYRERSSRVLVEIESDLDGLFHMLGPDGLRAHFDEIATKKFSDHGNVLEAAAYAAAADNADYCSGHYKS